MRRGKEGGVWRHACPSEGGPTAGSTWRRLRQAMGGRAGEAHWGVRYGGAWATPGERGPARGEGKGAGLERKEDGPCPKE
jgi:hypothetical protein